MYYSVLDNILFIESTHPQARSIQRVDVNIRGAFSQAQLKGLDDVKRKMIPLALKMGGNCIIEFKYGQRTNSGFFSIDNVSWYGNGIVAVLPVTIIEKMIADRYS